MSDTKKIRLRFEIDVLLNHDEYSGGEPEETAEKVAKCIEDAHKRGGLTFGRLLQDWNLLDDGHLTVRVVE